MEKGVNGWRIMWLLTAFDLPTKEKIDIRRYTRFRKLLLANGFIQVQYSLYAKFYDTFAGAKAEAKDLKQYIPPQGSVMFFYLTDKQFGMTENMIGRKKIKDPRLESRQLQFF
ncbi:CRISPR-associated endoribonuclease Cas2 [Candidatus Hepatincola sp. Av]